ncbi:MAG: endolytic transglycosylase MltG [Gammaproteobacteria bacterium]
MNRTRLSIGVLLVALPGLLVLLGILYSQYREFRDTPVQVPMGGLVYEVRAGTTLGSLARDLHRKGIIEHPRFFVLLGRELDAEHRLQAGEFLMLPAMTPVSLLETLTRGEVIQHPLTIVEGQTFREMMRAIAASGLLTNTLEGMDAGEIMARLGHAGEHPEGRFLPDTYHFPRGTTDAAFLQRAYDAMQTRLEEEWQKRAPDLPLANPYEALTLASIVEKETGRAEERPLIAGVFIQRLRRNMRLQTDPTVIYGLGDTFDGNIRSRDLRADTPYNTYTRSGLPPTPIAMPGIEAIQAVLHPDESGYLYFVATGDGRHYFSKTLEVHNQAVKKYQQGVAGIRLPADGTSQ